MVQVEIKDKSSSLKRIIAIAKIGIISILRNPQALFFIFFFPFIFITIFGILDYDNVKYSIGIRPDSDNTVFEESLDEVKAFNVIKDKTDSELDAMLTKGEIAVALKVVEDPQTGLLTIDIQKAQASQQAAETTSMILENLAGKINEQVSPQQSYVTLNYSTVKGTKFKAIDFILPGQLGFALMLNAMFGMAATFVSLRKQLVLKRIFATATKKSDIIIGASITGLLTAVLQVIVILSIGHYVFGYTLINGIYSFLNILLLSMIAMFVFLSMGILAANLCTSEDSIGSVSNLIMMPQLFLSGAFFELSAFPEVIQTIANYMPMTAFNEALKQIAFEGANITQVLPSVFIILAWTLVIAIIDVKMFKWE